MFVQGLLGRRWLFGELRDSFGLRTRRKKWVSGKQSGLFWFHIFTKCPVCVYQKTSASFFVPSCFSVPTCFELPISTLHFVLVDCTVVVNQRFRI